MIIIWNLFKVIARVRRSLISKCAFQDVFFSIFRNVSRLETVHLLFRIIIESFKQHYFFLASNTCDGYFAAQTRIRSDASSCYTVANLNAREFWCAVSGFGQCLIVSGVTTFTKFKCLAAKHSCLNPLWTYFLVTCPRLDPNDGISARGRAWISPEETVVVFYNRMLVVYISM